MKKQLVLIALSVLLFLSASAQGISKSIEKEYASAFSFDVPNTSITVICVSKYEDGKELKGTLSSNGKVIVPCRFAEVVYLDAAIRVATPEGKHGAYTYDGKVLYPPVYDNKLYLSSSQACTWLYKDGKWGAGDREGNIVAPCEYDYVALASKDYPIVLVNRGGQIRNTAGKEPNQLMNSYLGDVVGGKWGYCAGGKEIIPCQYDKANLFSPAGVATVVKDGQASLIKNPLMNPDDITVAQGGTAVSGKGQTGGAVAPAKRKPGAPVSSRYPAPSSDVDRDIPAATAVSDANRFAFIIANENYPGAPVPYALNDGRIFKEYCVRTLGIPAEQTFIYEDATFGNIVAAVERIKGIADAYDGEAELILYYAGHGVPDEKDNTAYLLPVDGSVADIEATGYSLKKLYAELSSSRLKNCIVFLDACFSGAKREDDLLVQGRGVAIKVKDEVPAGNMVVFSASTGDETAHQLESKGHGLFTYHLLKKLQSTGGNVTLGELSDYITQNVKRQSVVINNKRQTPTVIPAGDLCATWRELRLR